MRAIACGKGSELFGARKSRRRNEHCDCIVSAVVSSKTCCGLLKNVSSKSDTACLAKNFILSSWRLYTLWIFCAFNKFKCPSVCKFVLIFGGHRCGCPSASDLAHDLRGQVHVTWKEYACCRKSYEQKTHFMHSTDDGACYLEKASQPLHACIAKTSDTSQ